MVKYTQAIRWQPTNGLSVFADFVGLALTLLTKITLKHFREC